MQTKSPPKSIAPKKKDIANLLRLIGRVSFWIQLGFVAVCVLALLFAITGRNFSDKTNPAIGIGIFWAVCSVLAVGFNIYLAFRCTRIAKGLLTLSHEQRPKKGDTIRLLRLGVIVSLVGILLSLLGAGATVGVLVAKAVSQPPGVAITDPNQIIRGLDVFVMVANVNGIAAHFVGNITSLWLLDQLHGH
jgi:hypothetical protein